MKGYQDLSIKWQCRSFYAMCIIAIVGWAFSACFLYKSCSEAERDRGVQINDLAKMEFNLCASLEKASYCPIPIFHVPDVNTSGLSEKEAKEINDIFGQIRDYKTECRNMSQELRQATIQSLYIRSHKLRKEGVVVSGGMKELAKLPPPFENYEKAADDCYEEIKSKLVSNDN